ncbi:MAG: acyl-CoA thioesterase [Clostridia bacterium]|nr:acyl-CoA thioesterase [Clostridia bacterium]
MHIEAKTVDDSRVETIHIVRPNHLNGANRLFGGILMQWIDEVAGIVAKRHSMGNVTTASVDNLTFLHGAYQNEMVVIQGKLTWVGTTSMEVCVDTYVENNLGERRRINNAHFMMVALDENDKPMRVPDLILKTENDHLAWAHGEERRRIRNQRRKDNLDGF